MYKLDNNIEWTEELKNAFKTGTTRAKIIYDGNQEINETNMLKSLELKDTQYVPSLGFIGQACSKELTFSFVNSEGINLENKELTLKIGAEYNGDVYYITYGNFIVCEAPHNDKTNNVTSVVANDYMIKFDVPYEDTITYPCTLKELAQNICEAVGVELGSEEFSNSDFVVVDNQFEGSTAKEVIKNIAKSAFSWARIGQDNKLYFDLENGEEKEEEGTSFTLENPNYLQGGSIIKLTNESESTVVEGTTFELTDADVDKKHSIIELEGNTTQNGTPTPTNPSPIYTVSGDNEVVVRGKNLFNYNGEILENYINGSGMTYSVSNGEYTLNGSNTRTYIYIRYDTVLPAGTYFFSGCPSGGSTNGYSGLLQANGTNYFDFGSGVSFTLNAETTVKVYPIRVGGSRITVDNLKFKTQIEKGNTKTSFEPYTGNSYRVDFGGDNLLPQDKYIASTEVNGITYTNNGDGTFSLSGTASANTTIRIIPIGDLSLKTSQAYYLYSSQPYNSTTFNMSIVVNDSGTNRYLTANGTLTTPSSFTQARLQFYIASGNTVNVQNIELMLVEGNTALSRYSPYVSNPIELCKIGNYVDKLKRAEGKQLFDKDNMNKINAYFESNNVITASNYNRIFYIECEPNTTYTIAQNPSTSPISNHLLQVATSSVLPEIGVECTSNHNIGGDTSYTMTTNADAKYLVFRIRSGDDIDSYLSTIMINYGSTALTYEPYGNNWYIEKNVGKIVLNGSENWTINKSGTANWYYYANISSIDIKTDSTSTNSLCDHYAWGSVGVSNINTGYYIVKNNGQVRIRYGTEDTTTNYKTWLSSNNVTLYYVLANPTYETITNENLIEQLNNIQDIQLIENLCYVDWVGTEKPDMTLKYNQTIISGDNEILVRGRNLIPTNVNEWERGQYSASNGTKIDNSTRIRLKELLPIKPSTTYKNGNYKGLIVRTYGREKNFLRNVAIVNTNATLTTTAEEYYLGITIDGTIDTYVENTTKVMLIYNNITSTEWEAYVGNSYRVDFGGKNNFTGDVTSVSNGSYSEGVVTGTGVNCFVNFTNNTISVKSGETIYFSADIRLTSGSTGSFNALNDGTNVNTKVVYPTLNTTFQRYQTKLTYSSDFTIRRLLFQTSSLSGSVEIKNIMISNSPDILYSPYVSNPIELTEDDTIQKVEGEWCINEIPIDNEYLTTQLDNLQTMSLYEGVNYIDWIGKFKATMLLKYFSDQDVTFEEITTHDYKVNSFKHADEYYGRLNRVGYADSDIEGQEEYVQNAEDIEENGLKDLFIYDNLFAYTEAKRQQLVLAARKLLGFRYMPIQQMDLKGLIYLDCTDYLKIIDADEDETILYSRCLNHTIKYQGYVADSIESLAQSETERTFENLNSPILANTRTQVIVDKANKKINLAVESVEETQEKVSELEISVDGISSTVNTLTDVSMDSESSTATVTFENVNASEPIGIKVHPLASPGIKCICPISSLYPSNTLYMTERIIRFERTYEEEGETKTENIDYQLPADLLYYDSTHYDEFELDYNNKICKVIKRCQYNSSGSIVPLSQEQEIEYDYPEIILLDGDYTINIMGYNVGYLYVKLMKQNPYTSQFTTQVQTRSEIQVTAEGISSEVATKVDENEIISKINQSAEQIQINADKISIEGKAVNFTTNIEKPYVFSRADIDLLIEYLSGREQLSSEQIELYDVNGDGFVDTTDYVVIQKAIANNGGVINGTFSIDPYSTERSIILKQYDGTIKTYVGLNGIKSNNITGGTVNVDGSLYVGRTSNEDYTAVWATEDQISVRTPTSESVMTAYDVTTPEVIQTSREEDKKNFEKLSNGLDIILNTDIYKYHLKTQDDKDKKHIGFVIGNKFKHSREITSEKDNKEVGVDLYSMIAACYKAIQEQQNKIEELEKKIKEEN